MDLSIIIISYNTRDLLKKCLESVVDGLQTTDYGLRGKNHRRQKTVDSRPNIEIVVVDNASRDGSAEMVKKEFPKVRLVENKNNLGFAKAVNQALRVTTGKSILLLNPDSEVKRGAFDRLLTFEKEAKPAIVGAKLLNPDGTVQPSVFHLPTIKRAIEEYWFGKKGSFSKYIPLGKDASEVEAVSGGAMLISREVFDRIGFFDEKYFMYFEDLDYCRRARRAGFKVYYLPGAEIFHEHGASGRELAKADDQWRRLIPSSKIYHGLFKHYLINTILWTAQKMKDDKQGKR